MTLRVAHWDTLEVMILVLRFSMQGSNTLSVLMASVMSLYFSRQEGRYSWAY